MLTISLEWICFVAHGRGSGLSRPTRGRQWKSPTRYGVGLESVDFVKAGSERLIDLARGVDENVALESAGLQGFRPIVTRSEHICSFAPVVVGDMGLYAHQP